MVRPTYREGPLPGLVLGTAGLGGVWGQVDRPESVRTILYALEKGIKRLDTAPAYSQAETVVGEALRQWRGPRPLVSTKVGKLQADTADQETNDYRLATMQHSVTASQETLGAECLDLLFLHEPHKVPPERIPEVIDFMQHTRQSGTASAIGLGGIVPTAFRPAIQQGVFDVVMSYNNLDACCLAGMQSDIPFFRKHHLTTYQGSALHMGLLGNRFGRYQKEPPAWIASADLVRAQRAYALSQRLGMKLSTLAHRYLLSIQEVDYVVLGAKNLTQLTNTLADCHAGTLEETVFEELTDLIQ